MSCAHFSLPSPAPAPAAPLLNPQIDSTALDTYHTGHRADFYVNLSVAQGDWQNTTQRPVYRDLRDHSVWRKQQQVLTAKEVFYDGSQGAAVRVKAAYAVPMPAALTTPASGAGLLISDYKRRQLGWDKNYSGQRAQSVLTVPDKQAAVLTSGAADPTVTWRLR